MPKDPNSFMSLAERIWDESIRIENILWLAGCDADSPPDIAEEMLEMHAESACREVGYKDPFSGKPYDFNAEDAPKPEKAEDDDQDDEDFEDDEDEDDEEPTPSLILQHCIDERKQGFLVQWSWPVPYNTRRDEAGLKSHTTGGHGRWEEIFYTEAFDAALLDRMDALINERWEEIYAKEHGDKPAADA